MDATNDTTGPVLSGILARLQAERDAMARAERDLRDANDRYSAAHDNARALERLAELFRTYATNGDFTRSAAS